jgi:hypothetical protein
MTGLEGRQKAGAVIESQPDAPNIAMETSR